jgi:NAD(P)-dependent dehydrogenase (short-subunit alcohol dehydrogenase family)
MTEQLRRDLPLSGKNAIITGASRGLGSAVGARLRRQGASVLLVARSGDKLREAKRAIGGPEDSGTHIYAADLRDEAAPNRIIEAAKSLWPTLDIVVNNAAVLGPVGSLVENDWTEWRVAMQVNLFAPVALTKLALEWMRSGRDGTIINISGGGATSARPRFSAYACSKTALVRFTEIVAAEVAEWGIRVNCIAPGLMNTELVKQIVRAGPELSGEQEYQCALDADATSVERAAELVAFLASSESRGITGRLISAVWDRWTELTNRLGELQDSDIYTLRRITPSDRGKAWR